MRYYVLLVLISGAAYAAASTLAALPVAAAWPLVRRRTRDAASSARARAIATVRVLPAICGTAFAVTLSAAFLRYEPVDTTETPGTSLVVAASLTALLALAGAGRMLRSIRAGFECSRQLRTGGRVVVRHDGTRVWVVDTDYPVAAVTGIFRTRLLLSTRIIDECTPSELEAVVRHEAAHVKRRDNLVRAMLLCLPDPLSLLRTGREMAAAWAAAAEEAADDVAAGQRVEARTELASALLRVAKMTDRPAPGWMPALAFYEGHNLEDRVRRLLETGRRSSAISGRSLAALFGLAACWSLALTEAVARELHAWMELAVQLVP